MATRKINYYTQEEISRHNNEGDLWIIMNLKVYDVTRFHKVHPGGTAVLLQMAGKDATAAANAAHKTSLPGNLMKEFCIGSLDRSQRGTNTAANAPKPKAEKPKLEIVKPVLRPRDAAPRVPADNQATCNTPRVSEGCPPCGSESGMIRDLGRSFSVKITQQNVIGNGKKADTQKSKGPNARTSTVSKKRAAGSSSSAMRSRFREHGDAPTQMEIVHVEDDGQDIGIAEAASAASRIRPMIGEPLRGAWAHMRREFKTQQMVWDSLQLAKKQANGNSAQADDNPEIKTPQQLLQAELSRAIASQKLIEIQAVRKKDMMGDKLLNKSMLEAVSNIEKAEHMGQARSKILSVLDELSKSAESLGLNLDNLESPHEVEDLIVSCDLQEERLIYVLRRALVWTVQPPSTWPNLPKPLASPTSLIGHIGSPLASVSDGDSSRSVSDDESNGLQKTKRGSLDLSTLRVKDKPTKESKVSKAVTASTLASTGPSTVSNPCCTDEGLQRPCLPQSPIPVALQIFPAKDQPDVLVSL